MDQEWWMLTNARGRGRNGTARNGAERRGTARNTAECGTEISSRGQAGRRTNQRAAPGSAEVKHRTVPVLSINTPNRSSPLDLRCRSLN
jgi:hypothetical protein